MQALLPVLAGPEDTPGRLKRSESFLGIHFDFHAGEDCREIGKDVTREMVESILDRVKPDYIQVDSKGHRGLSSYPTKAGNPAPGFVRDPLRIWREAAAEKGVALYVHHSGVLDEEAVRLHPGWAVVDSEGKADARTTSVFGPYADSLLIPQVKEMIDWYGIDGIWVDGECWGMKRDYGDRAAEIYFQKTGIRELPRQDADPHWFEFSEFNRQGFRDYLGRYVQALHRHARDFEVASNWAYSSMMPEPVAVPVDFISGDFSATNSVNSARLEGRCMVHQGKPWDLMAWSFTWTDGLYSTKTIPQLEQEAAVVLALGGGFQAYFPQKRDASVRMWQMDLMEAVAKFCRARQSWCHGAEPVPQVGLVYSGRAFYRKARNLFAGWGGELVPLGGILQCLLESQQSVDIVMEHHLAGRMQEYPLLVWPEWEWIGPDFRQDLLEYVGNGGNLLVIGPRAAELFRDELGVEGTGEIREQVNGLEFGGWMAGIRSESRNVSAKPGVRTFGRIFEDNDFSGFPRVAASIADYGKGRIAGVYLNMGERYANARTTVARDFLAALAGELFQDPVVRVQGSHDVDVTLTRLEGRLSVNLVNTGGPHANKSVHVFNEVPDTGPLEITVRFPEKPRSVTLQPEGRRLKFDYTEGRVRLRLPGLGIHSVIVVE
jgi:hypothetical protein